MKRKGKGPLDKAKAAYICERRITAMVRRLERLAGTRLDRVRITRRSDGQVQHVWVVMKPPPGVILQPGGER